jgi:hypothetical protein
MAYDENLASRIRKVLAGRPAWTHGTRSACVEAIAPTLR